MLSTVKVDDAANVGRIYLVDGLTGRIVEKTDKFVPYLTAFRMIDRIDSTPRASILNRM